MRSLYWISRFLGILLIIFFLFLSTSIFQEKLLLTNKIIAFVLRLVPICVLFFFLLVAWRKNERGGGLLFILSAILSFLLIQGTLLLKIEIIAPLFLVGSLFWIHGFLEDRK